MFDRKKKSRLLKKHLTKKKKSRLIFAFNMNAINTYDFVNICVKKSRFIKIMLFLQYRQTKYL